MSLQSRIITAVFLILALTFGTFTYLVFNLPNNVRGTLDDFLEDTAVQMIREASSGTSIELEEINWPNSFSLMQEASEFYIVLDAEGMVVQQSPNLPLNRPISRELSETATVSDRTIGGQTLRTLTYPILG